jgi:hypothetical protein
MRKHRFTATRAVQPALPLGHAEVQWDALPRAVQDDVLARWCELLRAVISADLPASTMPDGTGAAQEARP